LIPRILLSIQKEKKEALRHAEKKESYGLFGSVVAVAFQITFRAKMHANDVFLFFKNYF